MERLPVSIPLAMNRTDPSPMTPFTPPVCPLLGGNTPHSLSRATGPFGPITVLNPTKWVWPRVATDPNRPCT